MNQAAPDVLAARPTSADVSAPLTFITPSDRKPVFESSAYTGGAPRVFFDTERHTVTIHDVRPLAGALSLDHEGFELHRHETAVEDLYHDDAVEKVYYSEIDAMLRSLTGAGRVIIFDATRRSDSGSGARNPDGLRGPASRVHVDYTEKSGPQRVKDLLGEAEAARLAASGARIIQINVWRPIRGPVERSPLALADASTVRPEDLIATDQVFPDRVGEIYHLAYHPSQRWYYAPRMTSDEVLLIKGWDSLDDGRARFYPARRLRPAGYARARCPAREHRGADPGGDRALSRHPGGQHEDRHRAGIRWRAAESAETRVSQRCRLRIECLTGVHRKM